MSRILTDADVEAVAQRVVELLSDRDWRRIEPEAIYRVAEAARLVGLHPDTLRKRLQVGATRGSRRAGDWRVRGAELLKLA
jgi:hypothetical protein